jgi:hypothetical protein
MRCETAKQVEMCNFMQYQPKYAPKAEIAKIAKST